MYVIASSTPKLGALTKEIIQLWWNFTGEKIRIGAKQCDSSTSLKIFTAMRTRFELNTFYFSPHEFFTSSLHINLIICGKYIQWMNFN